MSTIEDDKRNRKNTAGVDLSTSAGSSDDDNNKKDGPPDLNTSFSPEGPGGGGTGGNPPDLNTTFFEDDETRIDREQAKSEYKDLAEAQGYEPPSYADRSAQTDQAIAQGNNNDTSSTQDTGNDMPETPDKSADSTVDTTVEAKTEPASEPTTTTSGGPDKPHS